MLRAELNAIEYNSIAELREKSLEVLNRYMNAGTGIASAYGATFFQDVMAENGETTSAKTITVTTDEANEQAVRGMINDVVQGGSVSSFFDALQNRLDTNIRKASNECVLKNVKDRKKHLKFARVPVGRETCAWCFMLASYGFRYWSESSAGQNAHWHAHCDCRIIPGYDDVDPDEQVEGYKPSELQDRFRDCYNAVKMPNGSFDTELFERDVQAGKYAREDWERWKTNRIMAEIRSRDNDWLWNGNVSTVGFVNEEVKERKLRDYPHEIVTAEKLSRCGIKCIFQEDEEHREGKTISYADLLNGYELKTLNGCSTENTVIGHLKNCSKKQDVTVAIFDNSANDGMDDGELYQILKKAVAFRKGKIWIINHKGKLTFVR